MAIKGGVNHVTLRVKDLLRSEEFYSGLLGLTRVGERPGMHFYSSGHYNHELALLEDPDMTAVDIKRGGLVHIGFNIENKSVLEVLYKKFSELDNPVSAGVDHTISQSFYARDPDGYVIELTTDCPRKEWESNPESFMKDTMFEF